MVVYRLFNVIVPFTGLVKVAVIVFPLNVPEKLSTLGRKYGDVFYS